MDKNGRFVLRSGFGFLYQWYESSKIQKLLENDGSQAKQSIITNPGFPRADSGGIIVDQLQPSIYIRAANLKIPYIFLFQTALNMSLGDGLKFNTSYKRERGLHMLRSRDINAPLNGRRPNQEFGRIQQLESSGVITKNSFEVSGEGVLFSQVRLNGRYRLSKTVDNFASTFDLPMDNYDLSLERSNSNLDQRHYFTGSLNYSPV